MAQADGLGAAIRTLQNPEGANQIDADLLRDYSSAFSPQYGLLRRSTPIVVFDPCPG